MVVTLSHVEPCWAALSHVEPWGGKLTVAVYCILVNLVMLLTCCWGNWDTGMGQSREGVSQPLKKGVSVTYRCGTSFGWIDLCFGCHSFCRLCERFIWCPTEPFPPPKARDLVAVVRKFHLPSPQRFRQQPVASPHTCLKTILFELNLRFQRVQMKAEQLCTQRELLSVSSWHKATMARPGVVSWLAHMAWHRLPTWLDMACPWLCFTVVNSPCFSCWRTPSFGGCGCTSRCGARSWKRELAGRQNEAL